MLSPAQQRILDECRTRTTLAASETRTPLTDEQWAQFAILADMHLLTPMIALSPPGDAPAEYIEHLRQRVSHVATYNLLFMAELRRVLDALETHGIGTILFKGPIAAMDAHGTPAARAYVDADVLVPRDSIWRATALLESLGYRVRESFGTNARRLYVETYNQLAMQSADGLFVIELHTALLPSYLPLGRPNDDMFIRRRALTVSNVRVHTLSLEDHLLLLCAHGSKEAWPHLRSIVDVAGVIARNDIDWLAVHARAVAVHAAGALELGVALAAWLTGDGRALRVAPRIARIADAVTRRMMSNDPEAGPASEVAVVLPSIDRQRDRLRFAIHHVSGHSIKDWDYWPGGDQGLALTRATRPVRLAVTYAGVAARRLFRRTAPRG